MSGQLVQEPWQEAVLIASADPFPANDSSVQGQCTFMPGPHLCDGMALPPVALSSQGQHDLLGLDALLAEPRPVKH